LLCQAVTVSHCSARSPTPPCSCDVAVSGRGESGPQLNALIEAARNREIDCILVWKFNGFARSTRHLLVALDPAGRVVNDNVAIGADALYHQDMKGFTAHLPSQKQS